MVDKWSGKDNVKEMQWLNLQVHGSSLTDYLQCPHKLKQNKDDILSDENVWFCPEIRCQDGD